MICNVEMKQTSGSNLEGNEYIMDTEAYRHRDEEVAGDNALCMVPDESGRTLIRAAARAQRSFDVFSNRARGEPNLELEPKFICNPLFAPGPILGCHLAN